jgi:hypothetical protein
MPIVFEPVVTDQVVHVDPMLFKPLIVEPTCCRNARRHGQAEGKIKQLLA